VPATSFTIGGPGHRPPFLVSIHHAPDRVVCVAPVGELDLFGALTLAQALRSAQADAGVVLLDLRGLTFCEVAGLHTILAADESARRAGVRLVLIPGPPAVHRAFELTGVDRRLRFVRDEAQAGRAGSDDLRAIATPDVA
jgi:anti-sigma B factor antagonist